MCCRQYINLLSPKAAINLAAKAACCLRLAGLLLCTRWNRLLVVATVRALEVQRLFDF